MDTAAFSSYLTENLQIEKIFIPMTLIFVGVIVGVIALIILIVKSIRGKKVKGAVITLVLGILISVAGGFKVYQYCTDIYDAYVTQQTQIEQAAENQQLTAEESAPAA